MSSDYIKQVTVTGDVSSLATREDLWSRWCEEVAKEIWEQKCELGVVHVQGLLASSKPDVFAETLLNGIAHDPGITRHYQASRAFFDSRITGLGSLYLFRDGTAVQYYDKYTNTGYRDVRLGDDHHVGATDVSGFTSLPFETSYNFKTDFFRDDGVRDLRNQRTGYLLARFRLHAKELTFVNLALHSVPFEDIGEILSKAEVTKAARSRQQQIDRLLTDLEDEGLRDDAIIVAGAFNAQLHETKLLADLAYTQRGSTYARTSENGNVEAIEQVDRHGRNTVTVEEHRFDLHSIHDWFFRLGRGQMVKKYNGELAQVAFKGKLQEESVFFQPSRHYGVNASTGKEEFLKTLCPAWADRVLYNETMSALFRHDSFCASGLYYGLVGENAVIGEYKPVALHATICLK